MGERNEGETPKDFEAWLAQQPDDVREMYERHISGLKSALEREREAHRTLEKQLKRISKGEEVPEAIRTQLEALEQQVSAARRRADFVAQAAQRGAKYPKLLLAAVDLNGIESLEDDNLWHGLAEQYPDLFSSKPQVQSTGDAGAGEKPPEAPSVDRFIRTLAGRGA